MKKMLTLIVSCLFITSACSDDGPSWDDTPVYGFYQVLSGTQSIQDSYGTEEEMDVSGLSFVIDQSSTVVSTLSCSGNLSDSDITCKDAMTHALTGWGPRIAKTNGTITFNMEDGTVEIILTTSGEYKTMEYTYDMQTEVVGELTVEEGTQTQALIVIKPHKLESIKEFTLRDLGLKFR